MSSSRSLRVLLAVAASPGWRSAQCSGDVLENHGFTMKILGIPLAKMLFVHGISWEFTGKTGWFEHLKMGISWN